LAHSERLTPEDRSFFARPRTARFAPPFRIFIGCRNVAALVHLGEVPDDSLRGKGPDLQQRGRGDDLLVVRDTGRLVEVDYLDAISAGEVPLAERSSCYRSRAANAA
jgi:hypothetical protein